MSVKLMALTYEARFYDIAYTRTLKKKTGDEKQVQVNVTAATAKSVTLALADHANDEGEGSYPSLTLLEDKTELSRMTVVTTLQALKSEGVILYAGVSRFGTSNYTVNAKKLREWTARPKQERVKAVKPLDQQNASKATLPLVKPLAKTSKATLPEPSINHPINDDDVKRGALFTLYENEIGHITEMVRDKLLDAEQTYPPDWIPEAIEIAVSRNARNWSFVEAVLKKCKAEGKRPSLNKKEKQNGNRNNSNSSKPSSEKPAERKPDPAVVERIKQRQREKRQAAASV